MDATLYNAKGKEEGKVKLPEDIFGLSWNNDLVHQVVVAMHANARTPIAHTKFRNEVSGTGKKPWKQKGTGSARHGSRRSPIWRKGGVAHGPRAERSYAQRINKKMRTKALYTALSKKLKDGEVLFVDALTFDEPNTKDAKAAVSALAKIKGFEKLATKRKNAAHIATIDLSDAAVKSFRNFGNLSLDHIRNLNPAVVLENKYVVLVGGKDAVEELERRTAKATK